jgi:hypothetical protein
MGNLNKHIKRIEKKIKKFEKKGWATEKMKKELAYANGTTKRPEFKTGYAARSIGERKRLSRVVKPESKGQ